VAEGRLIALLGAKGGCGTTLLTCHLAATAQADAGVCAIDADFAKGDLAAMLDLELPQTIPGLLGRECDATLLRGSAAHHRAGFDVLGQPTEMAQLVRPLPLEVTTFLHAVRSTWGLVFVDCGSRVDDAVAPILRAAERVVLVTTPDVLGVRDAGRVRSLLARLGLDPARQSLVVNRAGRGLPSDEIADLLGMPVAATLPDDNRLCLRAIEEGALLIGLSGRPLSRALGTLWSSLDGEPPAQRRWRLPWMWGVA
jgi:pilus assembly protein CpaE